MYGSNVRFAKKNMQSLFYIQMLGGKSKYMVNIIVWRYSNFALSLRNH